MQRTGKQSGYAATLAAFAVGAAAIWALPERAAVTSRAVAGAEAWSEERVQQQLEAGPSGVRLFHRRLVPYLQGQ